MQAFVQGNVQRIQLENLAPKVWLSSSPQI